METIRVSAVRDEGWWVGTFTVDGREMGTQARRLDQLEAMVLDAAALMTDRPESDFTALVEVEDQRYADLVDEYRARAEAAAEAEALAARTSRETVAALREDGLPMREVARLMGISTQRVSQLAHA